MSETTSRLCCRVWLRLLGYLYVSLLLRRKPLLLDPDVRGRTDSSLIERWQPAAGGVWAAAELLRRHYLQSTITRIKMRLLLP